MVLRAACGQIQSDCPSSPVGGQLPRGLPLAVQQSVTTAGCFAPGRQPAGGVEQTRDKRRKRNRGVKMQRATTAGPQSTIIWLLRQEVPAAPSVMSEEGVVAVKTSPSLWGG